MRIFIFLILTVWSAGAHAGAWMKEPGRGFFSISGEFSQYQDFTGDTSIHGIYSSFLEYGLTEDLTIGYDATWSEFANKAILYGRVPIRQEEGKMRYAFEFGTGVVNSNPGGYLGLMVGKGVKLGQRYGWFSLENRATWDLAEGDGYYKIDATLGLTLKNENKILGQLQNEYSDDYGVISKATVSYVFPIWEGIYVETGIVQGLVNVDDTALKIGLWREF